MYNHTYIRFHFIKSLVDEKYINVALVERIEDLLEEVVDC